MITEHPSCKTLAQQARLDYMNLGTGVVRIRCYDTNRPTDSTIAPGGLPLVELPLLKPCGTLTNGIITLAPGAAQLVATTGTPVWGRMVNGNGATVLDCDVSGAAGSGDLKLTSTSLFQGGEVALLSGVLG